jgi:hypothetical protein
MLALAVAAALAAGTGALAPVTAATASTQHAPPRATRDTNNHPAVAAHPHLTADTPASCNKAVRPGVARCFAIVRTPSDHAITADSSGPPSTALGPADIQSAYGLPSATAGTGETVAVVDAGDDPTAESDLAAFRSQYGLPPCTTANECFEKVNQTGQQGNYPPVVSGWPLEESLDLDAISSACPNCHILLVEANTAAIDDLGASADEAVSLGATAVSNSYGSGVEDPSETSYDKYYNHPGVAVTASAGDSGYGIDYPNASQYVTSVGGTTLSKDTSVPRGWDETVWGNGTEGVDGDGTGSGCSQYEPQPSWQTGITQDCAMRAAADVSADANPNSGLAVYDTTGESGWLQVGGTSLSSPLIASTYALAGTPASGTYPSSYLYANYLAGSSVFNDITSGSNGDCGNVLCNAGTGWDGPTGLGTPDGVSGFTSIATGSVTGTVTDASTGQLIAGATVSIPRLQGTTGSDGSYTLSGLPAGSYQVSVSDYGYQTQTQAVTVTAGQATTENIQLTSTPHETVSGTVTSGTGTAWPLYAQVSWSDGNGHSGTVYTTPDTGQYSLSLLENGSYTLTVTPLYPGYQPTTQTVTVATSNVTQNIAPGIDTLACDAIGYHPALSHGTTETFNSTLARQGWTVTNTSLHYPGYAHTPGWVFNDPGLRGNQTGSKGAFAIVDSGHDGALHYQDTHLISPQVHLGKNPALVFDTDLVGAPNSTATVGLSINGGKSWTTVWRNAGRAGDPGPATVVVPLAQAVQKSNVRVRFGYLGEWSGYWEVDNVFLGSRTCTQRAGSLLVGRATDSSGNAVNGATVASVTNPAETATTAATPGDSSINGGLYDLFVTETGSQQYTASDTGYTSSTQSATLTAGQVSTLNFSLAAASQARAVHSRIRRR